ncbi:DinB family protein [Neobacillus sp. K501]
MDKYCQSVLHQIKFALTTTIQMIDTLEEADLQVRPTVNKHSVGELLAHIAVICKADLLISNGGTETEMQDFYSTVSLKSRTEIKAVMLENFQALETHYLKLNETELNQPFPSYWGTTYTKLEWLLEILSHVYHHRGQLHAMLVHSMRKDPNIVLFE